MVNTGSSFARPGLPEPDRQLDRRGTRNHTGRSHPANRPSATRRVRRQIRRPQLRNPALNVRIEYGQPIRSAITVAGIVGNAATTPGSAARPIHHRPRRARSYLGGPSWPTPPSPCSANNRSPARSPRSTRPPTGAAVGSQPSPPRSTPASSPARLRPGSRGSWSIFSCRTVVSIQLPSTKDLAGRVGSASWNAVLGWRGAVSLLAQSDSSNDSNAVTSAAIHRPLLRLREPTNARYDLLAGFS